MECYVSVCAWLCGVYISEVGDFGSVEKVSQTKSRPVFMHLIAHRLCYTLAILDATDGV